MWPVTCASAGGVITGKQRVHGWGSAWHVGVPPSRAKAVDCGDLSPLWEGADLSAVARSLFGFMKPSEQAHLSPRRQGSSAGKRRRVTALHGAEPLRFYEAVRASAPIPPSPRLLCGKAVTSHRTPRRGASSVCGAVRANAPIPPSPRLLSGKAVTSHRTPRRASRHLAVHVLAEVFDDEVLAVGSVLAHVEG